jgi:chromosome segregation ATPase
MGDTDRLTDAEREVLFTAVYYSGPEAGDDLIAAAVESILTASTAALIAERDELRERLREQMENGTLKGVIDSLRADLAAANARIAELEPVIEAAPTAWELHSRAVRLEAENAALRDRIAELEANHG